MIRIVLTLGLLSVSSMMALKAASAADLGVIEADIADVPSESWTGFHAGVLGGFSWSEGEVERGAVAGALLPLDVQNGLFPASLSKSKTGFIGGLSAGFDYQQDYFVAGIEGSVLFNDLKLRHSYSMVDPNPLPPFTGVDTNTTYTTKFGMIGTARARVGVAFNDTLFYGTGGVAAGRVSNSFTLAIPQLGYVSPGWGVTKTRYGYAAGAGIEHRFTDHLSAKMEIMHINLQDVTIHAVDDVSFPGETIDYRFKNELIVGNVGVSYRF